ncbi:activator of Hsp90 ATPase [Gloeopeniophorella convolvens]|nr:activator of Hsp90 ATPase [Gloeopeniophorella convolvens]
MSVTPMAYSTANWHWKNKTVTPWAKEWFERELVTITVEGPDGAVVSVERVVEVDGDVELGRRKSKLITIYDCKVVLNWKGTATDGTEATGKLTIPEVSHEITLDGLSDYVYQWSISSDAPPEAAPLLALAKAKLPTALEVKFAAFPVDLVETHGKDIIVGSNEPSRTGTPTPAAASASAPAKKAAAPAQKINTALVEIEATFHASADDLFALLTDEKRIPSWSRAPAKSAAAPDTEYELFGGGVRGKYISLKPGKEIKQTWGLQSPTWPSGHAATLTTTLDQSTDSTKVTFSLDGVPTGLEDETRRNLEGYYVLGFKSIGYVQLVLAPPQSSPPPPRRAKEKAQAKAPPKAPAVSPLVVSLGFAVLVLGAAFLAPYFRLPPSSSQ